jgi:hypothetical protein
MKKNNGQVITSKRGLSGAELMFHAAMCVCTAGLWTPIFLMRKRAADRTTRTYLPPTGGQ